MGGLLWSRHLERVRDKNWQRPGGRTERGVCLCGRREGKEGGGLDAKSEEKA